MVVSLRSQARLGRDTPSVQETGGRTTQIGLGRVYGLGARAQVTARHASPLARFEEHSARGRKGVAVVCTSNGASRHKAVDGVGARGVSRGTRQPKASQE